MTHAADDPTIRILSAAETPPSMEEREYQLEILEGPDAPRRVVLEEMTQRRVLVGQSAICDVRLTDRAVSRRHVSLEAEPQGVRVVDLGSSNGTLVGGVLVRDALVRGGEVIQVGTTKFRIAATGQSRTIALPKQSDFYGFVGASAAIRRLYPNFLRAAQSTVPVLVEGEAGTGKELLAEAIHAAGPRALAPFVVFERALHSPTEAEGVLFGRMIGGVAVPGRLEQASGGTLFFDEIADLELPLQIKLLRVLERRELRAPPERGGGAIALDVRIVAATRRDLDREVASRRFREELLAYLSPLRIDLPPLRRRAGDVSLLARYFWARLGGVADALSPDLLLRFEEHGWPGNTRELMNAVLTELGAVTSDGGLGDAALDPLDGDADGGSGRAPRAAADFFDAILQRTLPYVRARELVHQEFERRYLRDMLDKHAGNASRAAQAAGIGRRYFNLIRARQ